MRIHRVVAIAASLCILASSLPTTAATSGRGKKKEAKGFFLKEPLPVAMIASGQDLIQVDYQINVVYTDDIYGWSYTVQGVMTNMIFDKKGLDQLRTSIKTCIRWIEQINRDKLTVEYKEIGQVYAIITYILDGGRHGTAIQNACSLSLSNAGGKSFLMLLPMPGYSSTGEYVFTSTPLLFSYEELLKLDALLDAKNIERLTLEELNKKDDADLLQ